MNGARQLAVHLDAEFLVELADQRGFRRLAGMHLAAGKFPETGQSFPGRPLGEQYPAVGIDERHRRDQTRAIGQAHVTPGSPGIHSCERSDQR